MATKLGSMQKLLGPMTTVAGDIYMTVDVMVTATTWRYAPDIPVGQNTNLVSSISHRLEMEKYFCDYGHMVRR